jgi:DNA-binding beta-propeller fold protein YncE
MNDITQTRVAACVGNAGLSARLLFATAVLLAFHLGLRPSQASAADTPLVLKESITIPGVPLGPYSDHLAVDSTRGRLFATPQAAKAVAVLDLRGGRVLRMIHGIGNPHGIFYSSTLKRLFVVDGQSGDLKIFNGEDYSLIKTVSLKLGADASVYDPDTRLLYVNNGGEDAGMSQSLVSAVDTVRMEKVADIPVAAPSLEGSVIDSAKQLLYVNLDTQSAVAVVDLLKRRTVAIWKLPGGGHRNMAIALDTARARLYVACRDSAMRGSIIVLDATSGRPAAQLPIDGWTDGIFFDHKRQRVYALTGAGHIDTYAIERNGAYYRLPTVDTALLAKTGLYSDGLDRMYVDVPQLGPHDSAQVMVFKPVP